MDTLVNKPYRDRIIGLYKYYSENHKETNVERLKQRIKNVVDIAEKNNDDELLMEAYFMEALSYNYDVYNSPQKSIGALTKLLKEVKKADYEIIIPKIYRRIGEVYWSSLNNYELAFENYYKMLEAQKPYQSSECPDIAQNFATIGEAFYFFKDYDMCNKMMQGALTCPPHPFSDKSKNRARNAIGLCHQQQGALDSADYYFNLIISSTELFKLQEWKAIAKGNLGVNEIKRQNYKAAIPLLHANVLESAKAKDTSLLVSLYSNLGICNLNEGHLDSTESYGTIALSMANASRQFARLEEVYHLLALLHIKKGNVAQAERYFDSTLLVKDSLQKMFSGLQILRVNQKMHQHAQEALEFEKSKKTTQRNFSISMLAILLLSSIYIYFSQRKRYEQKSLITNLKIQKAETQLNEAAKQLDLFAKAISDKNAMVEQLEQKMGAQANEQVLSELYQHVILTDDDWIRFRELFDQVHQGFISRLKEKFPELSPSEVRFITLAKLNLDTKEMARTLGISAQSVRVTKHRLLKKINLPEDLELIVFINSI